MNKNNVVKGNFPKSRQSLPVFNLNVDKIKEAIPKAPTIKCIFAWLWLILRLPMFLILYWLRLPIIFLCDIISIPTLIAWLFAWYAFPDKTDMLWSFATVSFLAFVVSWSYDFILMALSPQDMTRYL